MHRRGVCRETLETKVKKEFLKVHILFAPLTEDYSYFTIQQVSLRDVTPSNLIVFAQIVHATMTITSVGPTLVLEYFSVSSICHTKFMG
jgi:hypothetical protein